MLEVKMAYDHDQVCYFQCEVMLRYVNLLGKPAEVGTCAPRVEAAKPGQRARKRTEP